MNTKTNNQQLSLGRNILESSETIPTGSTQGIVEAVPTLPDNAEGNDIVQKLKRFKETNSKEQFLEKVYKKITPTFFIVSKEGKFIKQYPGSWTKSDFLEIFQF